VEQFPVLPPATYELPCPWDSRSSFDDWLLPRVVELTYTASDLAGLAHDLGYEGPPFAWDEERRAVLRAELDACFFHLYGLERDDVDHVLDTFPIVERHDKTAVGEYRTKRLILEVYDAQAKAAEAGQAYVSSLDRLPSAISLSHATGATVNDLGA
jgi:hypothetical protein